MMRLVIPFRLPGLNDYIAALDANRYRGHKLKQSTEADIGICILSALAQKDLKRVQEYPVRVSFEWHEKTRKRDLDNIASAKKYILDALQKSGVLQGDGQKYVGDLHDVFYIPSNRDEVIVYIEKM